MRSVTGFFIAKGLALSRSKSKQMILIRLVYRKTWIIYLIAWPPISILIYSNEKPRLFRIETVNLNRFNIF